jgi:hypothetical protein
VLCRPILAIPILFFAYAIGYLTNGAAIASWLVIVFRGYQPRGLHNALVFALRWQNRAGGYLLPLDIYPPVGDEAPALARATA